MGEFERPFVGSVAVGTGAVSTRSLRLDFRRLHRDVYIERDVELTASLRAEAASLWAADDGILAGTSAAAIHGTQWIDPAAPAELFRTGSRRGVDGVRIHGDSLAPDEFGVYCGMLATTPARTGYDLGRRPPLPRAVASLDALCRATDLKPGEISTVADQHRGARHIVLLRKALELVDTGAESPQETRTRLILIAGDLPKPTTQLKIRDEVGRVVARADLGWEQWKVIVEYDGHQHWTDENQRAWDIERSEILARLGWTVIRVSARRLREEPWSIVRAARQALRAAGADI
ncbi:DUF559 domain-containing protein [Antrihabitans sp. YC2-6]|uniref:DUF559 domain-containing protein n=1 Tax=Antrihabitans sp. YC2-6 TaxID=2799498 RepID=UPI0018F79213|nr:DUF559 domain-containing protein [Antrihabitans sp. YC2-6]MBJ8347677.1 DUF559 domain-containing protein [Antrihabitans sp. YC2-6]